MGHIFSGVPLMVIDLLYSLLWESPLDPLDLQIMQMLYFKAEMTPGVTCTS